MKRRALAVLAGIVLLVQTATATAGTQVQAADDWPGVSCATGGFTTITASWNDDQPPRPTVRFDAWIRPCDPVVDGRSFAFTFYTHKGYRGKLRAYSGSTQGPTAFWGVLDFGLYGFLGTPRAVCVSYNSRGRAACVELDTGGPDGLPRALAIPTSDPRVTLRIEGYARPKPTCGTCL